MGGQLNLQFTKLEKLKKYYLPFSAVCIIIHPVGGKLRRKEEKICG